MTEHHVPSIVLKKKAEARLSPPMLLTSPSSHVISLIFKVMVPLRHEPILQAATNQVPTKWWQL
jgi:hypothetical protein